MHVFATSSLFVLGSQCSVSAVLLVMKQEYNVGLFSKMYYINKYKCLSVNSMFLLLLSLFFSRMISSKLYFWISAWSILQ